MARRSSNAKRSGKKKDGGRELTADTDVRREYFVWNLHSLTSRVLGQTRIDAAKTLGVDYGWLRKACSIGIARPNRRSIEPLKRIAAFFHVPLEALWEPFLLVQIWAEGYLPEARAFFIRKFHFEEFVKKSNEFQVEIKDVTTGGPVVDHPGLPEGDGPEVKSNASAIPGPAEMLDWLLATGKHGYLRELIERLYQAERETTA